MNHRFVFFNLPRELRDMIYKFYLTVDGGYVCDTDGFIKGKVKGSGNRPIDFSLVYACKQTAEEMSGLALQVNSITFTTLYSKHLRVLAGRFHHLRPDKFSDRQSIAMNLFPRPFPDTLRKKLEHAFPDYPELMQLVDNGTVQGIHFVPPSIYNEFYTYALQLVIADDKERCIDYAKRFRLFHKDTLPKDVDESILDGSLDPRRSLVIDKGMERALNYWAAAEPNEFWTIPSEEDMKMLVGQTSLHYSSIINQMPPDNEKYRFSAAAAAIFFLESLPGPKRKHLRNIILLEDRASVANPECHAYGLVPFCQENPRLRIERRVDLWRTVFKPKSDTEDISAGERASEQPDASLVSNGITWEVALWVMEAMTLPSVGMPPDSFRLLLDGDPLPRRCEEIFQVVVQRDVAWQLAMEELMRQGRLSSTSWDSVRSDYATMGWWGHNNPACRTIRGFPRAMANIAGGKSIVRFNFDVGSPLDVESLVHDRRAWPPSTWMKNWKVYSPQTWPTEPPLPAWSDIVKENILRRSEMDRYLPPLIAGFNEYYY